MLLIYLLTILSPVTGQTIDMGRGGRPRVPGGPGGPPQPSWSGSRTPMAALDSRTPAWGGSLSSRSKHNPLTMLLAAILTCL